MAPLVGFGVFGWRLCWRLCYIVVITRLFGTTAPKAPNTNKAMYDRANWRRRPGTLRSGGFLVQLPARLLKPKQMSQQLIGATPLFVSQAGVKRFDNRLPLSQ